MKPDLDVCASTLAAYERGAAQYVQESASVTHPTVAAWLSDLSRQLSPRSRVLELGSGPGYDAEFLEAHDLLVFRTDGARAFVDRLRADGHRAEVLNVATDPLDGPWDLLLANAVLHHLTRPQFAAFLTRAVRSLRTGGLFGFTLKQGDGEGWDVAKLDQARYFTYWQEPDLRTLLTSTGWRTLRIQHVTGSVQDWLYVTCAADDDRRDR